MFSIKIPYVIASHVKKYLATSAIGNKSKAAGIGVVGTTLYYNNGTTAIPIVTGSGVIAASGGATRTLTAASAGSINLFDAATGIAYTLPTPAVGLTYTFFVSTLQTAGANVVVTNSASVFLVGAIEMFSGEDVTPSSTLGPKMFAGNGTTHVKTTTNGTTTGGGVGSWMTFTCIAATLWFVRGTVKSPSGSLATPFST